jgi:beta-N-acetylhexosaminidase
VFRRDFADLAGLRELTRRLRNLARPRRIFVGIDEEGGFVSQLAGHLDVPPNALLLARGAAVGDIERAARVTGERLRSLGIDWVFAPVADIHSRPENPVIGPRAFGTGAAEVSGHVAECLKGFRAAGVASCLKHFPGHGDTTLDSHHALPRCEATRSELEERELVPFRDHLDADAVMTTHVVFPALDSAQPATFSRPVVHQLLREQLGFEGIAITDALEMKGAAAGRSPFDQARLALEAGCDLLLFAFHSEALRRTRLELARLLADGDLDRASFDAARPRLAAFDHRIREPAEAELARPLAALTPDDWEPWLEGIAQRGLRIEGHLPPARDPWSVSAPAFPDGPAFREELEAAGIPVSDANPAIELVAIMTRVPLPEQELERLRAVARERALVLVGLQNDAWLEKVPEAVLRVAAGDATRITRRVVARALAASRSGAASRG